MAPVKMLLLPEEMASAGWATLTNNTSYVIVIRLGQLMARIVGFPNIGAWKREDLGSPALIGIFPRSPGSLEWPPKRLVSEDVVELKYSVGLKMLGSWTPT
jgi:hypothetical protein